MKIRTDMVGRIVAVSMLAGMAGGCHATVPVGAREAADIHARASAHSPQKPAAGRDREAGGFDAAECNALDMRNVPVLRDILPVLSEKRVVFVGESHDQYAHHLMQLAIIRGMHQRHPDLVIGMEFFQQPFQQPLDDYIAGRIDEKTMLRRTEYFDRWRFDYRLYRPIMQFAREQGIRIIALNVPEELTQKVASGGIEALDEESRRYVPESIDKDNPAYRERLRRIFQHHPSADERNFEFFVEAQLLWDEGMASRAADYFRSHPDGHMVILAGAGHIAYRQGIPDRLARRLELPSATVVNGIQEELSADIADFVLLPREKPLPPAGRLGVFLESGEGGMVVQGFSDDSAARAAGIETGDRIVGIGDSPIASMTDIRIAMIDENPGSRIDVAVIRHRFLLDGERRTFQVTLQ